MLFKSIELNLSTTSFILVTSLNSIKEMLIASLLAILLASGLGAISYSLFAEIPLQETPEIVLDVYTQKGGRGPNMPGGSFMLNESVFLYGEIRDQLNETGSNKLIGFEVRGPNKETLLWRVQPTNASGIATIDFRIPLPESFVGTWEVYARAEYNDIVLLDTLTFRCEE